MSPITVPLQTAGILSSLIFLINFTFEVLVIHELYTAQYSLIAILQATLAIWALVEVSLIDRTLTTIPLRPMLMALGLQLMTVIIRPVAAQYIHYAKAIDWTDSNLEFGLATIFVPIYLVLFLAISKLLINAFSYTERLRANLLEKQMALLKRAEEALQKSESRYPPASE